MTISGFSAGINYFSAITAYSSTGEESGYSVELSFSIPSAGGTTAPGVGTVSQSVTFTPSDTSNYQPVSFSVNVTVLQATPLITTQPTASAITYGQTLASSSLLGGAASVPGAFAFTAAATIPAAGTASQSVTFTPTDTVNYQTITTSVNVTVNTAVTAATVALGNLAASYDGTPKSASATTSPAGITVNLTYNGLATVPTNAGSYAVVAAIADVNYTGSASGTLVIAKATPSIATGPTATPIIYGQALASSSLTGGAASVPGTFAFTTSGTAPATGSARFSWDAVADPRVSGYKVYWGTQSGAYDHSFDAGNVTSVIISGLSAGVNYFSAITAYSNTGGVSDYSVELSFSIPTAGGTTAPPAGTLSQSVTFTPTDTSNNLTLSFSVNVTVLQARPLITTQPTATAIFSGQSLASSNLVGGAASVTGSFAFTTPAAIPANGSASQSVTFTPGDTGNYLTASTTVSVQSAAFQAIAQESLESWRTRCFSPAQVAAGLAADNADPDGDGLVNLAEYALGTNPFAFTTPLTALNGRSGLVLTFYRPSGLPDVLYAADSSEDLINWNPCTVEMVADGPLQTMRAVDSLRSGNPARRFISLRFTRP